MNEFEFHSPSTLNEACALLKKYNSSARVLAGGTDLLVKMYHNQITPAHVVNIKRIPELNKITFNAKKGLTIGALATFNDIIYSEVIQNSYPMLCEVSKEIASHQIRNLATLGGNLCNAAPSADSAPILIGLDSTVDIIKSGKKTRTETLEQFFTGPGQTVLEPGEILTTIHIPLTKPYTGYSYLKHATRNALEIAVVGCAGVIQLDENKDKCVDARVVIGACAPTPLRVPDAEAALVGKNITDHELQAAAKAAAAAVKPITDVRSSEEYRREMVMIQTKRVLEDALSKANNM